MDDLIYFSTVFFFLINSVQCIDPRFAFRMLITENDVSSTNLEFDKNYQNDDFEPAFKSLDCKIGEKIYRNGDQWKTNDSCLLCYCDKGVKICDKQKCPNLSCKQQIELKGECCPICKDNYLADKLSKNDKMGCKLNDEMFFKAGSIWHPLIRPFGFDECVVCTCLVDKLTMDCTNICKKKLFKRSRSLKKNNVRRLMRRNFVYLKGN